MTMLLFIAISLGVLVSCLTCMGLFGIDSTKQESTTYNQDVALNNGGIGVSGSPNAYVVNADAEVANNGLDLAKAVANAAYETNYYVLDSANRFYNRGQASVDAAVAAAQDIARNAAPVSPGNYAEAVAGQNNKTLTTLAWIIGGIFLLTQLFRK